MCPTPHDPYRIEDPSPKVWDPSFLSSLGKWGGCMKWILLSTTHYPHCPPPPRPQLCRVLRLRVPLLPALGPVHTFNPWGEEKTFLLALDPNQVFKPAFSARTPFLGSLILVFCFSIGSESRGEEKCDSITPSNIPVLWRNPRGEMPSVSVNNIFLVPLALSCY